MDEPKEICLNCEDELEEDQSYCSKCGTEIPKISEEDSIQHKINEIIKSAEKKGNEIMKKKPKNPLGKPGKLSIRRHH